MAHRYVFTEKDRLRGEAVIEGDRANDWFNISPELAERMVKAPDYWIAYYNDDITITDKASVLEAADEQGDTELSALLKWFGVMVVIVGD